MTARSKNISAEWTKNLSAKEKEEFEDLLKRSVVLRRRIRELLTQRLDNLTSKELSAGAYETASWPYQQADNIGARRELKYLISLFDDLKE